MQVQYILQERAKTHGSFEKNGETIQLLKQIIRDGNNYSNLPLPMRESLDMILHKIGRIVNGDCYHKDTWIDISGYSQLIVDLLGE